MFKSARDLNDQVYQTENSKFKIGDAVKVLLLNFNSNNDFWVRDISLCNEMRKLEHDMQMCFTKNKRTFVEFNKIQTGELFACQMNNSGIWSRVEILGIRGKSVDVIFVDYGHINNVNVKRIQILPLPFKYLPQLAYHCKLYNFEMYSSQKLQNILLSFHYLIENKENFVITCKLIQNGIYFIEFHPDFNNLTFQSINNIDVPLHNSNHLESGLNSLNQSFIIQDSEDDIVDNKSLMKPNHKYPTVAKHINFMESDIKIKILNIFNPSNFWIHIVSDPLIFKLKKLQEDMAFHYNTKHPKVEFTPNGQMLYAGNCLLGQSMVWCRLHILDVELTNMTCSALLVDHGIIIDRTLENLYSLESQFMMPFLAVCCSITDDDVIWSKADNDKFKKYLDKSGILKAQAIKNLDHRLLISIFLSDRDKLDMDLLHNTIPIPMIKNLANFQNNLGSLSLEMNNKENSISNHKFLPSSVEKNKIMNNIHDNNSVFNLPNIKSNDQTFHEDIFNSHKSKNGSIQDEIDLSKLSANLNKMINTAKSNNDADKYINNSIIYDSKSHNKIINAVSDVKKKKVPTATLR